MNQLIDTVSFQKYKLKSNTIYRYYSKIKKFPRKNEPIMGKILLIASFDEDYLLTLKQTVYEMIENSTFQIDLLNVRRGVPAIEQKEVNEYDAIILHNTCSYYASELEIINFFILDKFEGIKILMKQDEHYRTNEIVKFVKDKNINLVLSIWDEEISKKIYSSDPRLNVEVMQYLTGYIPESYKSLNYDMEKRKIDVGYRGSETRIIFGRLCYEKKKIGEDFLPYAIRRGLRTDISSKDKDRFMGEEWLKFLGNCKCVLGVESGSRIVDFDGTIKENFNKYTAENPDATEEEILDFLEPYEHGISYTAISPRHFEAAACRTLQVMYEGEFQGIFQANRHYIPLRRDFSNIDEVIDIILDDRQRKDIVECAFEEIVLNDKYSFKTFMETFDSKILGLLGNK